MPLVKLTATGVEPIETVWTRLQADDPVPEAGAILVPLARWIEAREALRARTDAVGVWIAAGERVEELASDLTGDLVTLPVVALDFPAFSDGRAYSSARLLRERFGYTGEVRAIGDVLLDQLHHMVRTGFDALDVRAPASGTELTVGDIAAALTRYSLVYQVAHDPRPPVSALRRRLAARAPAGRDTSIAPAGSDASIAPAGGAL